MLRATKKRMAEMNPHIICILCGGYFIDATTIIECLHSFCRSCIIKYLESSKYCPICDVQVHKTKPLLNIRSDKALQQVVYKLVPGLYQNEMKQRRDFYAAHPDVTPYDSEDAGIVCNPPQLYVPEETISLSLEHCSAAPSYSKHKNFGSKQTESPRRYLSCPAAVTIGHLKKLLRAKYSLYEENFHVDIMYGDEPIADNFSLVDIAYVYLWKRVEPMHLYYQIFTRPCKRLKLTSENNPCVNNNSEKLTGNGEIDKLSSETTVDENDDSLKSELRKDESESKCSIVSSCPVQKSDNTEIVENEDKEVKVKVAEQNEDKNIEAKTVEDEQDRSDKIVTSEENQTENKKDDWKEVQLQISETGEIHVMDVESQIADKESMIISSGKVDSSTEKDSEMVSVDCLDVPAQRKDGSSETKVPVKKDKKPAEKKALESKTLSPINTDIVKEKEPKVKKTSNNTVSTTSGTLKKLSPGYKTLKSPPKVWNPSIPRSTMLGQGQNKMHDKNGETVKHRIQNSSKPPRFFKMRNVPANNTNHGMKCPENKTDAVITETSHPTLKPSLSYTSSPTNGHPHITTSFLSTLLPTNSTSIPRISPLDYRCPSSHMPLMHPPPFPILPFQYRYNQQMSNRHPLSIPHTNHSNILPYLPTSTSFLTPPVSTAHYAKPPPYPSLGFHTALPPTISMVPNQCRSVDRPQSVPPLPVNSVSPTVVRQSPPPTIPIIPVPPFQKKNWQMEISFPKQIKPQVSVASEGTLSSYHVDESNVMNHSSKEARSENIGTVKPTLNGKSEVDTLVK